MSPPILFDMDGVILEGPGTDPQVYADAADAALDELGAEPTPAQLTDLRRHNLEHISDHCDALGIDAEAFWKLKDEYASETSHDLIRSGERGLYDDIDALADLADRTTIGLVTNNRHATAEFVADHMPVEFDVVRGRRPTFDDFRRKKPEPDFIDDALSELGVDNGFYVGDSHKDVTAGRAAGLEPIYLRRSHNQHVDRPVDAAAIVDSLVALPTLPAVVETI